MTSNATFSTILSTKEKQTFYRQLNAPITFGKFKGKPLLNVPLYYVKWLYDNPDYLKNLFPEVSRIITLKLDPEFKDTSLEKEDFCLDIPECKCGLKPRQGRSNKQSPPREFYTCSKQVLNKFNGKYEGGCDFFKWGFPLSTIDSDGMVYYL